MNDESIVRENERQIKKSYANIRKELKMIRRCRKQNRELKGRE